MGGSQAGIGLVKIKYSVFFIDELLIDKNYPMVLISSLFLSLVLFHFINFWPRFCHVKLKLYDSRGKKKKKDNNHDNSTNIY